MIVSMKQLFCILSVLAVSMPLLAQVPLWDLAKNKIPADLNHGAVLEADGTVLVGGEHYFGLPADVFPDQRNFTVQVSVSFPELIEDTTFHALLKQPKEGEDTGFGLTCINGRSGTRIYRPIINGMHIGGIRTPFEKNRSYTFTVAVRDGSAAYYLDEVPGIKHFTLVLPNNEPMWVGKKLMPREKPFAAAKISALKVYGADYHYKSPKEKVTSEPRGAVAGKNWMVDAPTVTDPKRPKLLFYGDSISGGYRQHLLPALEGKVYAYHWAHFVGGLDPKADQVIRQGAAVADFDWVFFNNGLHSLSWTEDKASDEQIAETTRAIVRGFKTGAPRAKLFWLATTPHTARRSEPSKPVDALGDKNAVVLRINRIAEQVMKEEGVEVMDMYTPLAAKLELAAGDEYHWQSPAYKIISDAILSKLEASLKLQAP
jgi:lysophospholipase L1-like esterase